MRILDILTEAKKKKATKTRLDPKCWKNKKIGNPKTKVKGGVRVNNCVPKEGLKEGKFFNSDWIFAKDSPQWQKTIDGGTGTREDPYTAKFGGDLRILGQLMKSLALQMAGLDPGDPRNFGPTSNKLYYKFNDKLYIGDGTNKIMPAPTQGVTEGDVFFIEAGNTLIETTVVYESKGRIIIDLDDTALKIIESAIQVNEVSVGRALAAAGKRGLQAVGKAAKVPVGGAIAAVNGLGSAVAELPGVSDKTRKQWRDRATQAVDGTIGLARKAGTLAKKAGTNLGHAVTKALAKEVSNIEEAKYHGKEVPLGKRLPGDVKKSKVYVRKPNGKIVKVNFGDKTMRIKKSNPKRRKSFRARHNCKNPGPRWKARYWSCRAW